MSFRLQRRFQTCGWICFIRDFGIACSQAINAGRAGCLCVLITAIAIPDEGFLGTGAPFAADVNLVLQGMMAAALVIGAGFARRKRYRAHAPCRRPFCR
jgi:hypothetical protein